ncbi:uncharacterized protein LOC122576782 isoform X4 [Bombus pyrosoma]|uniref:uncharacterized protein LOC122576782 isoform X4 n=1 Tax=Bombus pyrosoma TaxID=396416 RepID=UPI001CB98D0C|nr:uncharacterized protein LOC122576782 isoform X4 [Bombus pyrosoma]
MGAFNHPTSLLCLYSPSLHAALLTQDIYIACTWHCPVPRYALDTHYEYFYLFYISQEEEGLQRNREWSQKT